VGASGASVTENIGAVRNWGYEAAMSARPLDTRLVTWDIGVNGSVNHNMVEALGRGIVAMPNFGFPSIAPGYAMYSIFDYPVSYSDVNHDGIIEPNEVTVGKSLVDFGGTYPKVQLTGQTQFSFFRHALTLGAVVDHRGGFVMANGIETGLCFANTCPSAVFRSTPLAAQAAVVALQTAGTEAGFYQDASFTRLREISLTYAVPLSVAKLAHFRTLSVTLAARNVALWTRFRDGDPENTTSVGHPEYGAFLSQGGVPPTSYWMVRFNAGL
jgi:hypothetical protein